MEGISIRKGEGYYLINVESLSTPIKDAIRKELSGICHGADQANSKSLMYSYKATLDEFLKRYDSKADTTKIGMIGELLSHILVVAVIDDLTPVSAYFNLEERSIKKGFDILLYSNNGDLWITEVKSGEIHKGKNSTETTVDLINTACSDLDKRLNENNMNHWMNAKNSALVAVSEESDYKKAVMTILNDEGDLTYKGESTSKDNNVFLISSLFSELPDEIDINRIESVNNKINAKDIFKDKKIISLKKSTFKHVENFLREEAQNA
ncbi:MAG: hypothetical protein ACI8SR_003000 [Oceanicoccus sp.]|jgi:hypothetical protein